MKITLKNSEGITFTIITNATYPFDTPCIGEDGKLYWLNRHNSNACFVDNEQLRYISPCKDRNGNHDTVKKFNKLIFDVVDTTDDYLACPQDRVELHICKNKINKIKEIFNQEGGNAFNDAEYNYREYCKGHWSDDIDDVLEDYRQLFLFVKDIRDVINSEV